ncbi:MAG TPA: MFS transporter [Solirubrobacteraceae bacterium]|nr:MFS transporter [Solirubrobacteraceae bacterium]
MGNVPTSRQTVAATRDPADAAVAVTNARWYFAGLAASLLGNSAMSLVAGIWVKSLTGSSAQAGLVSACIYAGTMGAPVAGLVADRFPRRRLLLALNLVSAATILPLALVKSRSGTWLLFVLMTLYGIEATLMDPTEDALFAQMFSPELRRRINGWRLTIQETGRLAAPLFGAGLFVLVGGGAVAGLDAATFVFAALVTARLKVDDRVPSRASERLATALLAGVRHILRTPTIRPVAIATTLVMALSGLGVAAQYSLVQGIGEHPAFLGVLSALLGAGSIVASMTASSIVERYGERTLAVIGLLNFALGNLLRANHWLPTALVGSAVLGFALPYVFLATLNVAQRATPNELQGRVSAALLFALFGPQALAQTIGSALIADATYIEIYVGSAIVSLGIAGWLARSHGEALAGGIEPSAE